MGRSTEPPRVVTRVRDGFPPSVGIRYAGRTKVVGRLGQVSDSELERWLKACAANPTKFFGRKRLPGVHTASDTLGTIYFITRSDEDGHPIKIGYSRRNLYMRLKNIQVGNPYPLEFITNVRAHHSTEVQLHAILAPHRMKGEWFEQCDLVRSALQAAVDGRLLEWVMERRPEPHRPPPATSPSAASIMAR